MRIFIIYGYILGFTLASPITTFSKCKEDLKKIDNTDNNGALQEETAYTDVQSHSSEILKMIPKMQSSLNYTGITGMEEKINEAKVKKQTSSGEIDRTSRLKYRHRRDLSQLIQKHPKRRSDGKKHRPVKNNKIIQNHNLYNTSRKSKANDMLKGKLEKGTIVKILQKRSIDFEDIIHDPYHSPDISYDWDLQENIIDKPQELNASSILTKNTEDLTLDIINENSDSTDTSESNPISSSDSSNLIGSAETNNLLKPNDSNSSNESSYNSEGSISDVIDVIDVTSEESTSDVINVRSEESISNSQESSELNVQNSIFTTPASDTSNELSESRLSSESWSQDNSSQTNEHNESVNSSGVIDSTSNESSNSSNSNTSSESTESTIHLDNSTQHHSWYIENIVITDDIEANEIHT